MEIEIGSGTGIEIESDFNSDESEERKK